MYIDPGGQVVRACPCRAECQKKLLGCRGPRVGSNFPSLVNDRGLQLECAKVYETLFVLILMYGRDNYMEGEV